MLFRSRWGNSLAIRIPKYVVEALNLNPNDVVECSVENGKLVIELIQALPELSLEELLAEVVESPEPEVDWGRPMGKEITFVDYSIFRKVRSLLL